MMDLQHNAEVAKTENRFVKVENYHLWPSTSHSTVSSGVAVNSAFRRLQNNNASSISSTSMNLRASVVNANVSTQSTNGVKVTSNSGNTGSIGSSSSSVPNRATSVNTTSLATARNVVTTHAHTSDSIATAGIPSATVTTMTASAASSASTSASVSAGNTVIPQAGYNSHHQVCARYMGSIGGSWPTVQVQNIVFR